MKKEKNTCNYGLMISGMLFILHGVFLGGCAFPPYLLPIMPHSLCFCHCCFRFKHDSPGTALLKSLVIIWMGFSCSVSRHALLKQCVSSLLIRLRIKFAFKWWNWADIYAINFLKQSFSLTLGCQVCREGRKKSQIKTSDFCLITVV